MSIEENIPWYVAMGENWREVLGFVSPLFWLFNFFSIGHEFFNPIPAPGTVVSILMLAFIVSLVSIMIYGKIKGSKI